MTERRCEACEAFITELDCLDCLVVLQSVRDKINVQRLVECLPPNVQSHCRNGHEMNETNTRLEVRVGKQSVTRVCRKCHNDRAVAQRLRNKASSVF